MLSSLYSDNFTETFKKEHVFPWGMAKVVILRYGELNPVGLLDTAGYLHHVGLKKPEGQDACARVRYHYNAQKQDRKHVFNFAVASKSVPALETACLISGFEKKDVHPLSTSSFPISVIDDLLMRQDLEKYGQDMRDYLPLNQRVMGKGVTAGKNLQTLVDKLLQKLQNEEREKKQEQYGLVIADELALVYFGLRLSLASMKPYEPLSGYEIFAAPDNKALIQAVTVATQSPYRVERGEGMRRNLQEIA